MFKTALSLILLFAAPQVFAQGGIGSSGGGDVVVTRTGEVRLVDLIDSNHDEVQYLDESEARNFLYRDLKNGESNYVLRSRPKLLDLGFKALESRKSDFPIFEFVLQNSVHSLPVADTEAYFKPMDHLMIEKMPIHSISERIAAKKQVVGALFDFNVLLVNRIIFEKMSVRDQTALMVHEALRNLNYFLKKEDVLTTSEIENIVRIIFLNESYPEIERKLAKLEPEDFQLNLDEILQSKAPNPLVSYDALLMKQFQRWSPNERFSLNRESFFGLKSEFSRVVANALWHHGDITAEGKFNVFSYDIDCKPLRKKLGKEERYLMHLNKEYKVDACDLANGFTQVVPRGLTPELDRNSVYLSIFY